MSYNVVFVLSSLRGINTGIGGHYRSVREIASLLEVSARVRVITFGDIPSPVFANYSGYTHIDTISPLSPWGLLRLSRVLKEISLNTLTQDKTFLVSVGWIFSYASTALASFGLNVDRLHLRPGGEAAKFPSLLNGVPLAVFHQKDYDTFKLLDSSRALALVPGRVTPPALDLDYLEGADRPFLHFEKIKVVCIMRVASDKRKPSLMIYNALSQLTEGILTSSMVFTHCGTVQDPDLLVKLNSVKLDIPSAFVTDPHTTSSAPKYLHGHDAFVGIGRGVIEAMSLGIPAFIPVTKSDGICILCAVDRHNWREFLRENFTHRTNYDLLTACGDIVDLAKFLSSETVQAQLRHDAATIYRNHLSPEASLQAWEELLHTNHSPPSGIGELRRVAYLMFLEIKRLASLLCKSMTRARV